MTSPGTMPSILFADSPDFANRFPTFDGIVILNFKGGRLVARISYGLISWSIRELSKSKLFCITSHNINALTPCNKEEFLIWVEKNSPADLEWLIWNLDMFSV